MFWYYPVWDVSYLVATIFTLGSVVWVINSFFVWLPHLQPTTEFPGEVDNAGGITAFVGATIFEIGSVFLMIEAVNENRSDCFGWVIKESLAEKGLLRIQSDMDSCSHHHQNMKNLAGRGRKQHKITTTDESQPESKKAQTWTWWPTWRELRSHYLHDIGFLGCLSQFLGATVFWISGFTALAPIQNAMSEKAINGAYWAPQVIGGIGFIISSFLFMLETQDRWYLPAPTVLGYCVGLFNNIGSWGFTLSGIFGYWTTSKGIYQTGCSTFWGSWAFLIGSLVQWYESLDKHPVDVKEDADRVSTDKNNPSNPHTVETENIPDVVK
jgi:hypothetical protein